MDKPNVQKVEDGGVRGELEAPDVCEAHVEVYTCCQLRKESHCVRQVLLYVRLVFDVDGSETLLVVGVQQVPGNERDEPVLGSCLATLAHPRPPMP